MMKQYNTYTASAHLYDLHPGLDDFHDLEFYLHWAQKAGGPILELACGTGRLTIPIAEAGYTIHGLDLSSAMLDIFARKIKNLTPEVAERITLHEGDIAFFDLDRRFGLIFCPFRSFQSLTTKEEQQSCLSAVKRHLRPGGLFIVDVFKPRQKLSESWVAPIQEDWVTDDPRTHCQVRRSHIRKAIDLDAQILDVEMVFEISREGTIIETIVDPLRLAYFYEAQMDRLLETNGLEIVDKMGDYDGCPVGEGGELIYICRG
jgi:ubiquinone/menaquinone biosynthesis C-methylase UbiE